MKVVVIGASLAGLFAAAAAASRGAETTILERDHLPDRPEPRKGVPQGRQAHVLLHRGLLSASALLPGLREDLVAHGASVFDGGTMPWLGEYGWMPTWLPSFELVSVTRPLLEHVVRQRVQALPGVRIIEGVRATALHPSGAGWQLEDEDHNPISADVVIDASGRSSRMPHWLADLGVRAPEPEVLDAQLGYACRLYQARGPAPLETGVVIAATPESGRGAIALPVENDNWLVIAGGYGRHRPGRDPVEFAAYLEALPDPAITDVVARLEPVSDVAVYRQTSNRRHRYGLARAWPAGLLVVGDAACAFNPVYGQGMTVAAQQAVRLREHWGRPDLQRRLDRVADFCWSVATSEDLRQPTSGASQNLAQQALGVWSAQLARLAAAGDEQAYWTFARVYHLMIEPRALFSPTLALTVARAQVRGFGPSAPRPEVLNRLRVPQAA
jgi:2-polyprenyl-6-methoxyphenol hydroxylase-like FAD-dependent oxidoreductase